MAEYSCRQAEVIGRKLGYPRYSKSLHSAAQNPEESGVMWVPELSAVFGGRRVSGKRKSEKRIKSHGWRVRLTPEAHRLLNARMKREGYSSKQAWLESILAPMILEERQRHV